MTNVETFVPSLNAPPPSTPISRPRLLRGLRAAWVVTACVYALALVVGLPIFYQRLHEQIYPALLQGIPLGDYGLSIQTFALSDIIWSMGLGILAFSSGFIVFWRRSYDWMALLSALALITIGTNNNDMLLALAQAYPAWRYAFAAVLYIGDVTIFFFAYLTPNGRFFPAWLRVIVVPMLVWEVFRVFGIEFNPTPVNAQLVDFVFFITYTVWAVGIFASIYRYRRAMTSIQRQQIKWLLFSGLVAVVFLVASILLPILLPHSTFWAVCYWLLLRPLTTYGPSTVVLLAITFSILRYRLYEVDLAVNRSLVYGAVSVGLIVIFLGGGFLLRQVIDQEPVAFGLSLVGAALLFNRTRNAVQHFIDRRFYGFRFDLNQLAKAQQPPTIQNPGVLTGRKLGHYTLLGVLGRGGMGEVYQGQDEQGHLAAIKILQTELALQTEFLKRFQREAKALAALRHPNIVRVYEAGETDGTHYIAMEYIEGRELSSILRERGMIPLDEVRPFVADFAAGLSYAHENGWVHRDVKPSNIMIRVKPDGSAEEAVLMDFGIAKIQEASTALTGTGAIGTIDYMSPEQILAAREVDQRADIYSLGVVVFEMLTGQRPFKGSAGQILFAHLQQPPPDPRDLNPELSMRVSDAILQALAKKPDARFYSVIAFAAALRAEQP